MSKDQGILVGPATWPQDIELDIPAADLLTIPAPDREAFFTGMVQFLSQRSDVEVVKADEPARLTTGASAPMLIPKTRVFIRFSDSFRDWYKKLIRMAAMYAIVGNTSRYAAFVGLSVDMAMGIFERLSRLDEVDARIVNTILDLTSSSEDGRSPSTEDINRRLEGTDDLTVRLSQLQSRGVIREQEEGWAVVF